MNLKILRSDWRGAMSENYILRFMLIAMIFGNVLLVMFMTSQEAIITLVPPDMNNDGWISVEEAFQIVSSIYTFRTYFWYHLIPFMATSSLTYFALKTIQSIIHFSLLPNNILIFLSLFCGLYNV